MNNKQWKRDFISLYTSNNIECIKRAIELKNVNIPQKLYRYRDFNVDSEKYRYQEICEGKLFLNPPKKLNDPFDSGTLLLSNNPIDYIPDKEEYVYGFKKQLSQNDIQRVLKSENWFDVLMGLLNYYYADLDEDVTSEFSKIPLNCAMTTNRIIRDIIQDYVKIACFTETSRNLPMWTLYGKDHTGICLEYDMTQFKYVDKIFPVFYSNTLTVLAL